MYPGTRVKWIDQSDINPIQIINEVEYKPLFCTAFSSDKGPEEWTVVTGQDFFDLYGTPNYEKYGQVSIQAGEIVKAGADLLVKRIIAPDATIANLAVYAKVDIKEDNKVEVSFIGKSFEGIKSKYIDACVTEAIKYAGEYLDTLQEEEYESNIYLLWVFTDIGRGKSAKRIRIDCNYSLSRTSSYPIYKLTITDEGKLIASYPFSINPERVADGSNISLAGVLERKCKFLKIYQNDDDLRNFISTIVENTGVGSDIGYDILTGLTSYGTPWTGEKVITSSTDDEDIINLGSSIGVPLGAGSDGCFKVSPLSLEPVEVTDANNTTTEVVPYNMYTEKLVEAFDGTFSTEIFNVDRYKIEAIFDANYPDQVKETISKLADFREDFVFFRDIGLGADTTDMIINKATEAKFNECNSKFNALYCQDYMVRDPYTLKRAHVTMLYAIAYKLVELLQRGHHNPIAGIRNGMIIDDAIPGTLNFNPVITPDTNQKEILDDAHINFASYLDDRLIVETEYTSQTPYTQLSWINNVMLTQHVIREIRTLCPQIRYSFITENDLSVYEEDVNNIIKKYKSYFHSIEFEYMKDEAYENNKIFYATIKVSFNNFVQSEYFEIIAISTTAANAEEE